MSWIASIVRCAKKNIMSSPKGTHIDYCSSDHDSVENKFINVSKIITSFEKMLLNHDYNSGRKMMGTWVKLLLRRVDEWIHSRNFKIDTKNDGWNMYLLSNIAMLGIYWVVPLPVRVTTRIITFLGAGNPNLNLHFHYYWEGGQPKVSKLVFIMGILGTPPKAIPPSNKGLIRPY